MTIFFNRSRFDLALQYYLTRVAGDYIWHYPSIFCTCSPDPNRAQPHCRACFGTGRVYGTPRRVPGLLTMATMHKDLMATGTLMAGDLVFSPDMHDVAYSDWDVARIDYDLGASWQGEVKVRQADVEQLMYPVKTLYEVASFNPATGEKTAYVEGEDFTLDGRVLTWLPGKGPAVGGRYSLRYKAEFEWVIQVPPAPRFERGTTLGMRIVLKLRHLVVTDRDT